MQKRIYKLAPLVALTIVGLLVVTAGGAEAAITVSGTTITLSNSDTIDNATDGQFLFSRNTDAAVTLMAADSSGATNLTIDTTGAGAITVGSADVTSVSVVSDGGTLTLDGNIEGTITRATGATGSYQVFAGDLTYEGAAGGTSTYHAGVMGNFMGDTLTNTNATIHAGTIGKYSVTTSDALVGPKAGLVGEAETSVANSAVMAVLGGDTGTVTPGAAYGVRYLNSTAASKFGYGLDLFSAAVGSYKAVDYGTADIRLQNGETISNGTDGTIAFGTANLTNSGTVTITSTNASALTVGANGATNPVLKVDASTASVATGVSITGAAAGSGATLASISSGTDEKLLLNSKGRSEIRLNSRTDSTTTGDFIGVQIKPGQGATKTANGVTGVEISPRLNDGVALTTGSIIGAHIDTYLKGTTGDIGGDVRGAQIELVTDDAGARTITGDVTGLRFRSAFSAAGITGNFQAIKIEKPETQTGSQTYDSVLTLTGSIPLVWNDNPGTEPSTADGYIKVIVDGNVRYIQLYSTAPVD